MTTQRLGVVACVMVVGGLSCAGGAVDAPPPGDTARSPLQRITTPVNAAQLDATVQGLNDFVFSLNRRVTTPRANFVSAPSSVIGALSMTSAGAAGTTLDGFRQALRVTGSQADFHHAINTLDLALSSRGQGANGINGKPFTLRRMNQVFAQSGYPIEAPFLDVLAQHYGGSLQLLDFDAAPGPSREAINRFVGVHTEQLIPHLLPEGSITSDTRVVLANAVYFNAAWAKPFEAQGTSPADFTTHDGRTVQVPTMRAGEVFVRTATVGGVEVIELPYEKDEVAMMLLLPAQGDLASFEQGLDAASLARFVAALAPETVSLSMPKLDLRTPTKLNDALRAEGLEVAYGDGADFSALSSRAKEDGLHITDVLHEAVMKVSEGGTEAAGATAVIIGRDSVGPSLRSVAIARPFVFVLRDRATGAVLFLGHVVDPS